MLITPLLYVAQDHLGALYSSQSQIYPINRHFRYRMPRNVSSRRIYMVVDLSPRQFVTQHQSQAHIRLRSDVEKLFYYNLLLCWANILPHDGSKGPLNFSSTLAETHHRDGLQGTFSNSPSGCKFVET